MTDTPTPRDVITKTCRGEIDVDLPFNAVADDILAALAAAGYVVEMGWQPIETAPMDGQILLWDDETQMHSSYDGDGETHVAEMRPGASHWRRVAVPLDIPPTDAA